MDWGQECSLIEQAANIFGVDHYFIQAIRKQENGNGQSGTDVEFGVISERGKGYHAQLVGCCATVRNKLYAYTLNPFRKYQTRTVERLAYTPAFIIWFASLYAPVGAGNDPTGLNRFWPDSVLKFYEQFMGEIE